MFLNEGAVTVDGHKQLKNDLTTRERIRAIRNHPSINATLIISVLNVMVGNQIRASDVDWRIISLQIFQNQTLQIRNFTGTHKSLKLLRTYQLKWIKIWKQYR